MSEQIALYLDLDEKLDKLFIDIVPCEQDIRKWFTTTLAKISYAKPIELSIRVVSASESNALNLQYRAKDKPTNVLSFPSDLPEFVESNYIGDIAICAELVCNEAEDQNKVLKDHWAHLCIHGLLHLLGYDHTTEKEAAEMEAIEVACLNELHIQDPYNTSE